MNIFEIIKEINRLPDQDRIDLINTLKMYCYNCGKIIDRCNCPKEAVVGAERIKQIKIEDNTWKKFKGLMYEE